MGASEARAVRWHWRPALPPDTLCRNAQACNSRKAGQRQASTVMTALATCDWWHGVGASRQGSICVGFVQDAPSVSLGHAGSCVGRTEASVQPAATGCLCLTVRWMAARHAAITSDTLTHPACEVGPHTQQHPNPTSIPKCPEAAWPTLLKSGSYWGGTTVFRARCG